MKVSIASMHFNITKIIYYHQIVLSKVELILLNQIQIVQMKIFCYFAIKIIKFQITSQIK